MMKRNIFKILLLVLPLLFFACSGNGDSSGGIDEIFSSDQTEEAVGLITEANDQLKQIKQLLKENEIRLEDLKTAMSEKNPTKVKSVSEDIIYQISAGMKLGEDAVKNIEKAERLNINDDFRTYLILKMQSLMKYSEAYKERFELAKLLRDKYDPNNAEQRKTVGDEFQRREEIFMNIMMEAGKLSDQANDLAKEANSRKKE